MGPSLESLATEFRDDLKKLEEKARGYTIMLKEMETKEGGDKGEYIAQSIIAMRHLEDARMRYGKVIQYLSDGVSCYDNK